MARNDNIPNIHVKAYDEWGRIICLSHEEWNGNVIITNINWRLNCSNAREPIRSTMMMVVVAALLLVKWDTRTIDVEATEAQTSRLTSLAPTRCCYNCSSVRRYLRIFHIIFDHCNERHCEITHSSTKNKCKEEKKGKTNIKKEPMNATLHLNTIIMEFSVEIVFFSLSLFLLWRLHNIHTYRQLQNAIYCCIRVLWVLCTDKFWAASVISLSLLLLILL